MSALSIRVMCDQVLKLQDQDEAVQHLREFQEVSHVFFIHVSIISFFMCCFYQNLHALMEAEPGTAVEGLHHVIEATPFETVAENAFYGGQDVYQGIGLVQLLDYTEEWRVQVAAVEACVIIATALQPGVITDASLYQSFASLIDLPVFCCVCVPFSCPTQVVSLLAALVDKASATSWRCTCLCMAKPSISCRCCSSSDILCSRG